MAPLTLAIDAMGGDFGLSRTIPASIRALAKHPDLHLILVGCEAQMEAHLKRHNALSHPRIECMHAPEEVLMDELPSQALRTKKKSSMRIAINLVKSKAASACVSAGNTGALMATSRFVLKTLPGIDRPALLSELPSRKGKIRVLDLGANLDSCAEHLFQFAIMGNVLIEAVEGLEKPRVGLLNIGVEEIKGNDQVKRTAHMLSECDFINYIGYVEGDDIYCGDVDLVVCDGFVGNAVLKASEGLAKYLSENISQAFRRNILSRIMGCIAYPVLSRVKNSMNPAAYNGASFLGLNGIVVKSHGSASILGFQNAIEVAKMQVAKDVPELLGQKMAELLNEGVILV